MGLRNTQNKLHSEVWRNHSARLKRNKRMKTYNTKGNEVGPQLRKSWSGDIGRPYIRLRKRQADFTKDD